MKMPEFRKKICKKAGFTLVELLVTIFLVSVGLVGVLSFFNSSLQSNFEAKNELIAAGLTQEGTELVRNIRDYNILSPDPVWRPNWYSYLYWPLIDDSWCDRIDYRSLSSHICQIALNEDIYYRDGKYRHRLLFGDPASSKTVFQRTIDIARNGDLDAGGYLEVTCTVTWNDRTTTATDRLYNNSY